MVTPKGRFVGTCGPSQLTGVPLYHVWPPQRQRPPARQRSLERGLHCSIPCLRQSSPVQPPKDRCRQPQPTIRRSTSSVGSSSVWGKSKEGLKSCTAHWPETQSASLRLD